MRLAWKIFRAFVSVLLLLAVFVPAASYVLLSIDGVQNKVRGIASKELSRLLGADVGIERVRIHPFNRLSVRGMSLCLDGDTISSVGHVSAGFELYHFLHTGELVIDYALVDQADLRVTRTEPGAPLNVQPILDHLKSDEPREDKPFELKINTVILRRGCLSYDVLSEPEPAPGRFDVNHILVENLAVNAYIPQLSNSVYQIDLDHLSFVERSGLDLKRLQARTEITDRSISIKDLAVDLNDSRLSFEPITLAYNGFDDIRAALHRDRIALSTRTDSRLSLADASPFVPKLAETDLTLMFGLKVRGNLDELELERLTLRDANGGTLALNASATAANLDRPDSLDFNVGNCSLVFDGRELGSHLEPFLESSALAIINRIPVTGLNLKAKGNLTAGSLTLKSDGEAGALAVDGSYARQPGGTRLNGEISITDLNAGLLTANPQFGFASAEARGWVVLGGGVQRADAKLSVGRFDFGGYPFHNINAAAKIASKKQGEINITVDDPCLGVLAYFFYDARGEIPSLGATATVAHADFNALGLDKNRKDYIFGAKLTAELQGDQLDNIGGEINVFDISWLDSERHGLRLPKLRVTADPRGSAPGITVESALMDGSLNGIYTLSALPATFKALAADFVPALFGSPLPSVPADKVNDFTFDFTLHPSDEVSQFFKLPVAVVYDTQVSGEVRSEARKASLTVDAPYLRQGNKIIENTNVYVRLDSSDEKSMVYATTQFPTKKGNMAVSALINALNNRIDTRVNWMIERLIPINGTFDFSTEIFGLTPGKSSTGLPLEARVNFNPGTINFGDETWAIQSSAIELRPDFIDVRGFGLDAGSQRIDIEGRIGREDTDSVTIALDNIALLPIFETLEIDKAMIGGRATGVFTARDLLGDTPVLVCPHLHVNGIGYNRCTIGDADIYAAWNNEKKSFYLDADIIGPENKHSHITGDIFPLTEALDIDFSANEVPVGFLRPFMEAFTSDISGFASGHCRLFGTFKEIDLEGDVYADNVKIKIDFTNTYYIATDSVHIRPGEIKLDDITIRDIEGHTAKLNGEVGHTFFKAPTFRFDITDARNFLSFNGTPKENPDWYGKIYGNGGASVSGRPGVVNINVNMTTAPGSSFTFELSDRLDAEDYSFITFRDATPDSLRIPEKALSDVPEIVRALQQGLQQAEEDEPSAYNMDIRMGITKDARMTLVMDPTAGDEIKATGEGNLRLTYHSVDNDLSMWGSYTVDEGSYRFTLQDIIIKDFIIKQGSEIKFDGDPYGVKTSLEAYYATNANLSDLDKSFLQDKDLNRTNVPVHALMKVNGDVREPEIKFDLEFPTLNQDTYRKVRSIVSTEDMMNRQIIYLLALNRFYTPDYMESTTKGSELFSVASSTISSQLSSMLGKLSDNWSVAPNLRSDRGDFSDVEVDVTLSSRLLNNRLLFNGNFGYRDKSLNTNQFIGDFDIEYLLNKRGTWRLKAYNRYNDRNYYLRSAQTTQGVGIIFRRDFDNLFSFLRKKHTAPSDTTAIQKKSDSSEKSDKSEKIAPFIP